MNFLSFRFRQLLAIDFKLIKRVVIMEKIKLFILIFMITVLAITLFNCADSDSSPSSRYIKGGNDQRHDSYEKKQPYGLTATKQQRKVDKLKHPYKLEDTQKNKELKSNKNPYKLQDSSDDNIKQHNAHPYRLREKLDDSSTQPNNHPYKFQNSPNTKKEENLSSNHPYGLKDSKKQKEKVSAHPYKFEDSQDKKLLAKTKNKHPYKLEDSRKQKKLKKNSKNPYGLKDKVIGYKKSSSGPGYFPEFESKRNKQLTAYKVEAEKYKVKAIQIRNYRELFKKFKKPQINALLIANQDYEQNNKLKYAENDIDLYEELLKDLLDVPGKRIHKYSNLNYEDFTKRLKQFINKEVKKGELVMIFYIGHCELDARPILTDMKSIPKKEYEFLINSFDNDTVVFMDISNPQMTKFKSIKESIVFRTNVLRIYNSLVAPPKRENKYKDFNEYKRNFRLNYALHDQIGYDEAGNGIFTLLFSAFFSDYEFSEAEVSFETVYSFMHNKISSFEERGVRGIRRPIMYPFTGPKFKDPKNNYILYRSLAGKEKRLSDRDRMLRAMYKKALRMQRMGKYKSAIDLFLGVMKNKKDKNYEKSKMRLAKLYLEIGSKGKEKDPEAAIENYNRALKHDPYSVRALERLERIYKKLKNPKKAAEIKKRLTKARLLRKKRKRTEESTNDKAVKELRLGYINYNNNNPKQALIHFERALRHYKQLNDKQGEAIVYNNMGATYNKNGDSDQAIDYYKLSIKLKIDLKDNEGIANTYSNMGIIYFKRKEYSQATDYLKKSIPYYKKLPKITSALAQCYLNLVKCYLALDQDDDAVNYQKKAVAILRKINHPNLNNEKEKLDEMTE